MTVKRLIALMAPLVFGLGLIAFGGGAQAAARDERIHEIDYDPDAVYSVTGAFRTATQIIFSPQETIRHAAVGDSVAWEVAAEGSVLFLKPRERHQPTNLLVVTERGGEIRHYAFALSARSDRADAAAFQLRFRYPDDQRHERAQAAASEAMHVERRLIGLELDRAALDGPRNLAWSVQGAVALQPSEVTDNGRFTVLRFPQGRSLPALYEVGDDGEERLIPYDVRGEFVVIHGAPTRLRLRQGRKVLCLYNDAPARSVSGTGTGTASPTVDRRPVGGLS
ncbi:TrbG/VirB9 family P-type conjugative transfer protein [Brevundimonas nasdae]|uniref:TrbG/VirB9 family P-type conjugative transfer protein n=1 Tax=Brevundimonas nasdae TaxID=172043 RepID=A0ABX8TNK8_9CAUL|nr:TrbG/VirB9 family P-type conjugative transfer protein [Brevundimonas nasdae]QYC11460.1 TrbG/VirB9 family P-type conjugative transfer protein [Brevundimonas nasdae]QYC14248.1 TrbG/VirB9 family P-type conjugative transfer protein [Brevundimonas nasdae]